MTLIQGNVTTSELMVGWKKIPCMLTEDLMVTLIQLGIARVDITEDIQIITTTVTEKTDGPTTAITEDINVNHQEDPLVMNIRIPLQVTIEDVDLENVILNTVVNESTTLRYPGDEMMINMTDIRSLLVNTNQIKEVTSIEKVGMAHLRVIQASTPRKLVKVYLIELVDLVQEARLNMIDVVGIGNGRGASLTPAQRGCVEVVSLNQKLQVFLVPMNLQEMKSLMFKKILR